MTPPLLFQTTIQGHAVDAWCEGGDNTTQQHNDWQLSGMQRMLLSDTPWIRVVDAPTGAGKSYAFQKAVLPRGKQRGDNVLFIAPTRRLTENLADGLREGLLRETRQAALAAGLDDTQHQAQVDKSVLVWNGQQNIGHAPQGRAAFRNRQFQTIETRLGLGRTVFTVLELVRDMLFPTRLIAGEGDNRGTVWLSRFKHVVFDEFHTLGADGMALALVIVAMVQAYNRRDESRAAAAKRAPRPIYLTFLSATPVDVLTFLAAGLGQETGEEGVPATRLQLKDKTERGDGICLVDEPLIHQDGSHWPSPEAWPTQTRYRALHGDVIVQGHEAQTLEDLVSLHAVEAVADILAGRQVVCLWDSKAQLIQEHEGVLAVLQRAWHASGQTRPLTHLEVHAAADRRRSDEVAADISTVDVVMGTASVEAGVTFRGNRLLFMEPGFTLLNMVQRLGRCARGMYQGQPATGRVVIRLDPDQAWRNDYRDWLGVAVDTLATMPPRVRVDDFLRALREAVWPQARGGLYHLDGLDARAQARASLFWAGCWNSLEKNGKLRSENTMGHPPGRVKWMKWQLERLENTLKRPASGRRSGGPASVHLFTQDEHKLFSKWWGLWRQESQSLREIAPSVWVVDTNRNTGKLQAQPYELLWLARFTTVLKESTPCSIEQARRLIPEGGWNDSDQVIQLPAGKTLRILPKDERPNRKTTPPGRTFLMPDRPAAWMKNSAEAAHSSAGGLESIADRAELKLRGSMTMSQAQKKEGQDLVDAIRAMAKIVRMTGRAVPDDTHMDSVTATWCESLVV